MSGYTALGKPLLVMSSVSTIAHDNLVLTLKLHTSLSKMKTFQLIGVTLLKDPSCCLGMHK